MDNFYFLSLRKSSSMKLCGYPGLLTPEIKTLWDTVAEKKLNSLNKGAFYIAESGK